MNKQSLFPAAFWRNLWALVVASVLVTGAFAAQVPEAYKTVTRYDPAGRVTGTISPLANGAYLATRTTYEPTSGLVHKTESGKIDSANWPNEDSDPASWAFNPTTTEVYDYDDLGRKIKTTQYEGGESGTVKSLVQVSYDDYSQVVCKAQRMNPLAYSSVPSDACALGSEGNFGPDRITKYTYNDIGKLWTETRALGTVNEQLYQKNTYYPGYASNQTNNPAVGYLLQNTCDANNNCSHFDYYPDSVPEAQRIKRLYFPSKTASGIYDAGDYEEYDYDNNGNRFFFRKRDGNVINYSYDPLNRVVLKDIANSTTEDVTYMYNMLGLQTSAKFTSTPTRGLTTTFNGFGFLETESTDVNGTNYNLNYQYDADGNRLRISQPGNQYFTYQYDGLDRITDILENGNTVLEHQTYSDRGQPSTLTDTGNVQTALSFGSNGDNLGSELHSMGYTLSTNTALNLDTNFSYNPAGQAVHRTTSNDLYQYLEQGSQTGDYQVNGQNQYTSVGGQAFGYDANGNLTSDGRNTYVYDVENRLRTVTGASNATLSYDPNGRLYQIVTGGLTTYFLYSGDALVAEYQNGTMNYRYISGPGVDKPLVGYPGGIVSASSREFYHVNHQGSVVLATNSSGKGTYLNTYDAYGVPGEVNNGRFGYTGQLWLPEIGMNYYKARIYYPGIGRFLQVDPIGYKDDMDLYAYVGDDPFNKTDPTGLECNVAAGGKDCHFTISSGVVLTKEVGQKVSTIADKYNEKTKKDITVTSGTRDAKSQADAMKGKLDGGDDLSVYKDQKSATEIKEAYNDSKAKGESADKTVNAMTAKINTQISNGVYISNHLKAGAVDVSVQNMTTTDKQSFKDSASGTATTVIEETTPPHMHLQF